MDISGPEDGLPADQEEAKLRDGDVDGLPIGQVADSDVDSEEDEDLQEIFETRCGAKLVFDFLWCINGTRIRALRKIRKNCPEDANNGRSASPRRPGPIVMSRADVG